MLSFVIPAYRSEGSLPGVIEDIAQEFPGAQVVVVVDGSPGPVAEVAWEIAKHEKRIQLDVIELRANRGQHYAVLRGFAVAHGEWVVTIDDDGQNPPREVHKLLAYSEAHPNIDCVYGRFRSNAKQRWSRRLVSWVNQVMAERFMRKPRDLEISNVRLLRGDLARMIAGFTSPYPFIDALLLRTTKYLADTPVEQRDRTAGESTYTWRALFRLALSHYTIFSSLPLVIASVSALMLSAALFIVTTLLVLRAVVEDRAPEGWASIMAVMGVMFSATFLVLSVVGIYVGRLYVAFNAHTPDYILTTPRAKGRQ